MDAQRCVSKHERVYARLPARYVAAPVLRDGRAQPRWKNVPARRAPSSGRGRGEIRSEDARVNTTHYPAAGVSQQIETHTLSVLVDNEPGVLARVIGLFSGRGYNIDSLTVSETEHEKHLSRITIVTRGTPMVIEQIKNQLDRLVPVHRVIDMTVAGPHIERELAMVKVRGKGEHRMEALRLADAFRARVIDASTESFVFEITGASEKIESFVALMIPLGLIEVSRTGIVAIGRGPDGM
jgi:acetolactate synthase I/III small subunit